MPLFSSTGNLEEWWRSPWHGCRWCVSCVWILYMNTHTRFSPRRHLTLSYCSSLSQRVSRSTSMNCAVSACLVSDQLSDQYLLLMLTKGKQTQWVTVTSGLPLAQRSKDWGYQRIAGSNPAVVCWGVLGFHGVVVIHLPYTKNVPGLSLRRNHIFSASCWEVCWSRSAVKTMISSVWDQ